MNQATDPEHDTWRAPWAPPARPDQPQTAATGEQGSTAAAGDQPGAGPQPEHAARQQVSYAGGDASTPQDERTGLPAHSNPTQSYPAHSNPTQSYPSAPAPTLNYPTAGPPAQDGPAYGPSYPAPAGPADPNAYPHSDSGSYNSPPSFGGYGQPAYISPDPGYGPQPQTSAVAGPPAGPDQPRDRRDRGGPGWFGVIAIGAGAAILASALTGGVVALRDHGAATTGSSFTPSQSAPQVQAPVSNSSKSLPDWDAVAAAVEPSVVTVQLSQGEGSGVILDAAGRILTNNHVVAEGGSILVVLNDGRQYAAEVVGTDAPTDLAVIKLTKPPSGLKPAVLGDSGNVKVGDPVMAVGNPLGLAGTVTTGIVSAVNRPVTTKAQSQQDPNADPFGSGQDQQQGGEQVVTNAIQTDAAINPGNSGGALVDALGRLIGINSSIASLSGSSLSGSQPGNIGLGFSIPVNQARTIAQQLIKSGSAQHAWIGVSLQGGKVTVDGAQRATATIAAVTSGSPAEKAGLKQGDQVIAIDGTPVNGSDSLVANVRARQPGAVTVMTIVRDGKSQDIKVTLGTRPGDKNG